MHLCTCNVALGGDIGNVVHRGADSPVSWPEVGVIQLLHGETSVTDIQPLKTVRRTPREEKVRLTGIYGAAVENLYPGFGSGMEMFMPGVTLGDEEDATPPAPVARGRGRPPRVPAKPVEQTADADADDIKTEV